MTYMLAVYGSRRQAVPSHGLKHLGIARVLPSVPIRRSPRYKEADNRAWSGPNGRNGAYARMSGLGQDAEALGGVERGDLEPGRPVTFVGPDLEVAGLQPLRGYAVLAGYLCERDGPADRVAIAGSPNVADPLIGQEHWLVAEQVSV